MDSLNNWIGSAEMEALLRQTEQLRFKASLNQSHGHNAMESTIKWIYLQDDNLLTVWLIISCGGMDMTFSCRWTQWSQLPVEEVNAELRSKFQVAVQFSSTDKREPLLDPCKYSKLCTVLSLGTEIPHQYKLERKEPWRASCWRVNGSWSVG